MNMDPMLVHFLLTVVLSFLVGMEMRTYMMQYHEKNDNVFFGSVRTFTFAGIIGFVFYSIDTSHLIPYTAGMLSITLLYAIFYQKKLEEGKRSILAYFVLLAVYSFGPLATLFPLWVPALLFVLIVFILNARQAIHHVSLDINTYEFTTLGKMVLLSAVILPLLPEENIIPYIPLSPFKIWLVVVVISMISYGGYLTQKYFFPSKGYFLTGIIGGTYSSTATTVVLAKKAREVEANTMMTASIVAATAVMYIRLIIVAAVFNLSIAEKLLWPFLFFALLGFLISWFYYRRGTVMADKLDTMDKNPLELGTAFIFAALFVLMMLATNFVTQHYGSGGLKVLSFVTGFTDIDPFVLSLLTGKYSVGSTEIFSAMLIAAGSNNILKALYTLWFGGWTKGRHAFLWLTILGIATIAAGIFYPDLIHKVNL